MKAQWAELLKAAAASISAVAIKALLADVSATRLLSIPTELVGRGWLFTIVGVVLGTLAAGSAWRKPHEPDQGQSTTVYAVVCIGAAVFFLGIHLLIPALWKRLPLELFDFLYFWAEPISFGIIFAFVAAALRFAIRAIYPIEELRR